MVDDAQVGEFTLEFTEDPACFLNAAEDYLARDPVVSTVVATIAHRAQVRDAAGEPRPDHPQWWVALRSGAEVVGAAMRTAPCAPFPMFVLPMPEAAARELARALHERGEEIGAANGALPATRVLAEETARLAGRTATVHQHTRLFELGTLVAPRPVPGRCRPAGSADAELAVEWFSAFHAAADEQAGRVPGGGPSYITSADVLARIETGRIFLWEDAAGQVVHLTGATVPSFGVSRVGPVYTPPEQRGRGYASACVAKVSQQLLDVGVRVCLFTDQANPTSNRIYQALGYEPVVDMANLLLGPARTGAPSPV